MNSLFGVELPTSVTFIIAFVIVLALIGAAAWLVRRFGAARLAAGRGRQPRLAVIDAAAVDGRRKLIIIRRDNVEHLLMIGGPSDVVVETNIMRTAAATQREGATPRVSVDALPRAVPLPDATNWPLQPEPALAPRAERPRMISDEPVPMAPPPQIPMPMRAMSEPLARPPSPTDPLIGLAAELSRSKFDTIPRPPEPPRIPLTANYSNADSPIAPAAPAIAVSADVHLAEMAQRLETALRRPLPLGPQGAAGSQRPTAANDLKRMESRVFSAAPTNGPANGNGAPANSIYEDLEQEMASLLGRQSGKT
jgi:flagellar protein FliO/FliZ